MYEMYSGWKMGEKRTPHELSQDRLKIDESFRQKTDENHHKMDTPLVKLPIDLVEDVIVADSLHLFDLGTIFI